MAAGSCGLVTANGFFAFIKLGTLLPKTLGHTLAYIRGNTRNSGQRSLLSIKFVRTALTVCEKNSNNQKLIQKLF